MRIGDLLIKAFIGGDWAVGYRKKGSESIISFY